MSKFKKHILETIKLSIPISLGQVGHIMMGVVDSIMVGKVGTDSLAAASLVNGLFFLILVLGIGMSTALSPLIAMSLGANKPEECGKTLNNSLFVNMAFAIVLMTLMFIVSLLIPYLNQPTEVVKLSQSYLQILILSIIPFLLFQTYRQFLEGLSIPNPPMLVAILANLLNAFLNWIFIYGNLGAPALGLFGAGLSTTLTRTTMAFSLMFYVISSKKFFSYSPQINIKVLDKKLITKIIQIGLPSGFQFFMEMGAFSFAAVMIGWLGSTQLAAHQIAINLASITYMIILGISSAGSIRVGNAVGKNDKQEIRYAGFTALGLAITLMSFFGLSFVVFRNLLPHIYINDPKVIDIASQLLIIAAMFQVFDGSQVTGLGILRGLLDVRIPTIMSFISYWIIAIPVALLLGFGLKLGIIGIWTGLSLGLAALAVFLTSRFAIRSKKVLS
ncbi:MATE family efflux transporter [Melioribacteraceae bacterium 4301-Me]|uniref:MATE family efflux transporter n=1 Tax=Pyranulibacter aquaticus TaxID=3163344 RepID=UPI003598356B